MHDSLALDEKYVSLLSNQLLRFKITRRNPLQINFRCPFCGDSKKDFKKARGYVYEKNSTLWYSCRNCSKTTNVPALIKHVDDRLHNEYIKEKYQSEPATKKIFTRTRIPRADTATESREDFVDLPCINDLRTDHTAYNFLVKRKIPLDRFNQLFYADKFFEYANTLEPGKFDKKVLKHDEPRIVIPFFDKNKKLITIQGRALGESKSKYITIKIDKDQPHIFGGDAINHSNRVYIVEGPFDSMFLSNALAVAQSDLASAAVEYGADPEQDFVLVFDNEPRNKDIVRQMKKAVSIGFKICIWPPIITSKDINELVLQRVEPQHIQEIIDQRTYSGVRAELELGRWIK